MFFGEPDNIDESSQLTPKAHEEDAIPGARLLTIALSRRKDHEAPKWAEKWNDVKPFEPPDTL